MARKLEFVTNIAILIVAALASVVLVKNYLSQRTTRDMPQRIAIGTKLSVPGIDWGVNGNTLVLALSTNCHYCTESSPFYRRLSAELPRQRVHLTALLPENVEEGAKYVRSLGLQVSDVRQGSFQGLKIRGTPTLMLVDERGLVRFVWEGKLSAETEQQVIDTVLATPPSGFPTPTGP